MLLALGDSIAAGEGQGPHTGFPDNTGAYPARLANRIGIHVRNYAISGACAASGKSGTPSVLGAADPRTPDNCTKSILSDELPTAFSDLTTPPSLITMTVGADDIFFSECFKAALGIVASDPCNGRTFQQHLAAYENNLNLVGQRLSEHFAGIPVAVTNYFNPLPSAGSNRSAGPVCPVIEGLYLGKQLFIDHQYRATAFAVAHGLDRDVRNYQNDLATRGSYAIGKINGVIRRVANRYGWHQVSLDFTDHDFCTAYGPAGQAFVFGPIGFFSGTFASTFTSTSIDVSLKPSDRCTPAPDCDSFHFPLDGSTGGGHQQGHGYRIDYSFYFGSNDMPHLTPSGSDFVARRISQVAGFG